MKMYTKSWIDHKLFMHEMLMLLIIIYIRYHHQLFELIN